MSSTKTHICLEQVQFIIIRFQQATFKQRFSTVGEFVSCYSAETLITPTHPILPLEPFLITTAPPTLNTSAYLCQFFSCLHFFHSHAFLPVLPWSLEKNSSHLFYLSPIFPGHAVHNEIKTRLHHCL